MAATTSVSPRTGYYLVMEYKNGTMDSFSVSKNAECTCGGSRPSPCLHVEAVKKYLKTGGRKAPCVKPVGISIPTMEECPICGAEAKVHRPPRCTRVFWDCIKEKSHFWFWLGGEGVKEFLTKPHPNKLGPFYEMSIEERAEFLGEHNDRPLDRRTEGDDRRASELAKLVGGEGVDVQEGVLIHRPKGPLPEV